MKILQITLLFLLLYCAARAQDSIYHKLHVRSFMAPTLGIAAGASLTFQPSLRRINEEVRNSVQKWRNEGFLRGTAIRADDVMQYTPFAAMYFFKLCGMKGKHDYAAMTYRATVCYSLVLFGTSVAKSWSQVSRPDNVFSLNSFFSGHTSTAFASAEMLRLEYGQTSPWIGIGAYGVSTVTGLLRIYNNRHWFGDVLAGAGMGILCAQLSYWFCDMLQYRDEHGEQISPYHGFRL
ncbi:MAG: phosphatase PAP2 family protein [Bacteroidales bacterium]|nr:phosphatase PAP2 family protein [Bacteroidales bacterium]